eukprot:COSAG01_NODE_39754_length_472_cov_1.536193_1_plen_85_part_10
MCATHAAECAEPHPAVVCSLPVTDPDFSKDDLLAVPHVAQLIPRLTTGDAKVCDLDPKPCACIAQNAACDELSRLLVSLASKSKL